MAVPKRKMSKSRVRSRTRAHRKTYAQTNPCPQCGVSREPHRLCAACGYYGGRQVITIKAK